MIRQNNELNHPCEKRSCSKCRARRTDGWRERLAAMLAAWCFWLSGIAVILADGSLPAAVAVGVGSGGAVLVLTLWVTKQLQERDLACQ